MRQNGVRSDLDALRFLVANHGWIERQSAFGDDGSTFEIAKDGLVFFWWIHHADADAGLRLADGPCFMRELPEWYTQPGLAEVFCMLGLTSSGVSEDFLIAAEHHAAIKSLLENRAWHMSRAEQQAIEMRASYASLDLMKQPDAEKLKLSFLLRQPWLAGRTKR
jgi:hypothetical protein